MEKITKEEIIKLAQMSKISISDNEIPVLLEKIDAVLTYASSLNKLVKDNAQSSMPFNINVMRDDIIIPTDPEPLLRLAPVRQDNYYVVPVILKND